MEPMSAEAFTQFAAALDAKAGAAAPAAPAPQEGIVLSPDTPSEPAAAPAPAAAAPVAAPAAAPVAAAPEPAAAPAVPVEELPRDNQGRFVKVAVHAREIGARDAQIRDLQARLDAAAAAPATPKSIAALDAVRTKLAAEYPAEFGELIGAFENELLTRDEQAAKMQATIDRLDQARAQAQQVQASATQSEVDTALAAVPALQGWRDAAESDDATQAQIDLYEAAIAVDKQLRASPAWKAKPMAERFQEVAARVAKDFGVQVAAPAPAGAPATPPAAAAPVAKPLPAQPAPASLSAIPSGVTPATPEAPAENLSLFGSIRATKNMTRGQAERFLLHGGS